MALIGQAIFNRAVTFEGINALIDFRIYPLILPQVAEYPALSYFRVSSERVNAMSRDALITRSRIQISAWDETYDGASTLAQQVLFGFQRFKGLFAGITVHDCFILDNNELYDPDVEVYQHITDIDIIYNESEE